MIECEKIWLLVPPSNDAALADAIEKLLADPLFAARLGKAARQRVTEVFTREQQLFHLIAILEKGFALSPSPTSASVLDRSAPGGST